jgi:glycosyltransferase involved in cell wall biosynthesis
MPFVNLERYLGEAVESVLAQTYRSWELILVDDGSTDGSARLAQRYALGEPERIRCLSWPGGGNRGASAARNLGLADARGEFIAFLDGDDVWLPEKLEQQVAMLRSHPSIGALYGRTLYWRSWTNRVDRPQGDYLPALGVPPGRSIRPPRLLGLCLSGDAMVPATCSIVLRRSVVDTVGGFEEDFKSLYDDQAFYAKLMLATPMLPVDVCWDKYRQHSESTCARAQHAGELRAARLRYLDWLVSYLRAHPGPGRHGLLWTLRIQAWRCRNPVADDVLLRLAGWRSRVLRRLRGAVPVPG